MPVAGKDARHYIAATARCCFRLIGLHYTCACGCAVASFSLDFPRPRSILCASGDLAPGGAQDSHCADLYDTRIPIQPLVLLGVWRGWGPHCRQSPLALAWPQLPANWLRCMSFCPFCQFCWRWKYCAVPGGISLYCTVLLPLSARFSQRQDRSRGRPTYLALSPSPLRLFKALLPGFLSRLFSRWPSSSSLPVQRQLARHPRHDHGAMLTHRFPAPYRLQVLSATSSCGASPAQRCPTSGSDTRLFVLLSLASCTSPARLTQIRPVDSAVADNSPG